MIEQAQPVSLAIMFMVGLMGSGHCVGMCGGIATGLGLAAKGKKSPLLVVGYNLGRIISYAIAGILVATLGYWGRDYLALGPWLRIVAGVILLLMGLYLAGWHSSLAWLERLGSYLWKKIQPLGNRLMPVESVVHAVGLGLIWGWLPCGLVYTALAYSATAPDPLSGGAMMVAFGLGTAPAMIAGGLFSTTIKPVLQTKTFRRLMAVVMIGFGCWTLYGSVGHMLSMGDNAEGMESHHDHH